MIIILDSVLYAYERYYPQTFSEECKYTRENVKTKSTFTCNRDEISSQDQTCPGMKKFLFTSEFHPGMKRVELHPWMKFNLKENLPLSMKTYNKVYHWYVKISADIFVHHFRLLIFLLTHFRRSLPEVFCIKGLHRNFAKFTGKPLRQSLFFNKVAGWPATLFKKWHSHRCFPVNFSKFLRTSLLTNTSGGYFWHFQTWCYEKEQNRIYSTSLTTIECGLNENNMIVGRVNKVQQSNLKEIPNFLHYREKD